MTIPGQPDGIKVTTDSGEEEGSRVANTVQGLIAPNKKIGKMTFDAETMWLSAKAPANWVSVQITFPYEVELTRIAVHSQYNGEYHLAQAVRIAVQDSERSFRQIMERELKSADDTVTFPKTKGHTWRLEFRAGESRQLVLRGLQFFVGADELFPPLLPYQP